MKKKVRPKGSFYYRKGDFYIYVPPYQMKKVRKLKKLVPAGILSGAAIAGYSFYKSQRRRQKKWE